MKRFCANTTKKEGEYRRGAQKRRGGLIKMCHEDWKRKRFFDEKRGACFSGLLVLK